MLISGRSFTFGEPVQSVRGRHMTEEEAKALKKGDRVSVWAHKERQYVAAKVSSVIPRSYPAGAVIVYLRRMGKTASGSRYPLVSKFPWDVYPPPARDTTTANVFADWLEDEGFTDAASALRLAFPIENGKGEL